MGMVLQCVFFTEITKIPSTHLRKKNRVSVVYIDDNYLQGKTYEQCLQNITDSINILQESGFTIHPITSCLTPTKTENNILRV